MIAVSSVNARGQTADPNMARPRAANGWGGSGPRAVEAPPALPTGSLVAYVGAQLFDASNVFESADSSFGTLEIAGLAWTPIAGLEIGLGAAFLTNTYTYIATIQRLSFGNPSAHIKYGFALSSDFRLGVAAHAQAPTAVDSISIVPSAGAAQLQAIASYLVLPAFELLLNLGFVFDRSSHLTSNLTDDGRFALTINGNRATAAIAAIKEWTVGPAVALSPFIELTGYLAPGVAAAQNGALASVGLKALFNDRIEVTLGGDGRLWGEPQHNAREAGLPPWRVFALASLRVSAALPEVVPSTPGVPEGCTADTDCATGEVCHLHRCVLVEVQRVVEPSNDANVLATFTLAGHVVDSATGKPVADAQLTLSGFGQTRLAVNGRDGGFTSWPLPAGTGMLEVHVTAPGYKDLVQGVPRGTAGTVAPLTLTLVPADQINTGVLKGTVSDAATGEALAKASLFIPKLRRKILVGEGGTFSLSLKPGPYDVVVFAPGFASQRKRLRILEGDVFILNVEMERQSRHRLERD